MSKTAAKKDSSVSGHSKSAASAMHLDQNTIRRAAKARRKNSPKKTTAPGFSIAEMKKAARIEREIQRAEEKEAREELYQRKQLGLTINACIESVFAGTERTGLCRLSLYEQTTYQMNSEGTDYEYDEHGEMIALRPRFEHSVRLKASQEIIDWCESDYWNSNGEFSVRIEDDHIMLGRIKKG